MANSSQQTGQDVAIDQPVAYLYTRDDGSKDLVLDCDGEYARRLLEMGCTETPLYAEPADMLASQRRWRDAFESMHRRAMIAEAELWSLQTARVISAPEGADDA